MLVWIPDVVTDDTAAMPVRANAPGRAELRHAQDDVADMPVRVNTPGKATLALAVTPVAANPVIAYSPVAATDTTATTDVAALPVRVNAPGEATDRTATADAASMPVIANAPGRAMLSTAVAASTWKASFWKAFDWKAEAILCRFLYDHLFELVDFAHDAVDFSVNGARLLRDILFPSQQIKYLCFFINDFAHISPFNSLSLPRIRPVP